MLVFGISDRLHSSPWLAWAFSLGSLLQVGNSWFGRLAKRIHAEAIRPWFCVSSYGLGPPLSRIFRDVVGEGVVPSRWELMKSYSSWVLIPFTC